MDGDSNQEVAISIERVKERFEQVPFHAFLGLSFEQLEPGVVEVRLPFRQELVSNPDVPYLHGGAIATLLDVAGDFAIATLLGHGVPTIDMRVDFLRAAGCEPLIGHARMIKLGRSLGVADAEVRAEGGEIIAVGRFLYSTKS